VFAATAADDEDFHGTAASLGNELKSSAVAAGLCRRECGRDRAATERRCYSVLIACKIAIA
jgi:hypothetical protein